MSLQYIGDPHFLLALVGVQLFPLKYNPIIFCRTIKKLFCYNAPFSLIFLRTLEKVLLFDVENSKYSLFKLVNDKTVLFKTVNTRVLLNNTLSEFGNIYCGMYSTL